MAFDLGPWDKKAKTEGAHVFGRKLLYGDEHDSVEHLTTDADAATYGTVELHKMHAFWRRNVLKMISEQARRTPKGQDIKISKVPGRKGVEWPGDLGKHHALIEELLKLDVVTIHQTDRGETYAKVHAAPLHRAYEQYCSAAATAAATAAANAAAAPAAAPAAPPAAATAPFVGAAAFAGAWAGYVFKMGEEGLGYYRDGPPAADAEPPLPDGWVSGQTAEGYVYFWHGPTGTSSWERPTGPRLRSDPPALGPMRRSCSPAAPPHPLILSQGNLRSSGASTWLRGSSRRYALTAALLSARSRNSPARASSLRPRRPSCGAAAARWRGRASSSSGRCRPSPSPPKRGSSSSSRAGPPHRQRDLERQQGRRHGRTMTSAGWQGLWRRRTSAARCYRPLPQRKKTAAAAPSRPLRSTTTTTTTTTTTMANERVARGTSEPPGVFLSVLGVVEHLVAHRFGRGTDRPTAD